MIFKFRLYQYILHEVVFLEASLDPRWRIRTSGLMFSKASFRCPRKPVTSFTIDAPLTVRIFIWSSSIAGTNHGTNFRFESPAKRTLDNAIIKPFQLSGKWVGYILLSTTAGRKKNQSRKRKLNA